MGPDVENKYTPRQPGMTPPKTGYVPGAALKNVMGGPSAGAVGKMVLNAAAGTTKVVAPLAAKTMLWGAPALEAYKVGEAALDPSKSKTDVLKTAGAGGARLGGMYAGAESGAVLGGMAAPFLGPFAPIAPAVGALVGGGVGYWGGGKAAEGLGMVNTPESIYAPKAPAEQKSTTAPSLTDSQFDNVINDQQRQLAPRQDVDAMFRAADSQGAQANTSAPATREGVLEAMRSGTGNYSDLTAKYIGYSQAHGGAVGKTGYGMPTPDQVAQAQALAQKDIDAVNLRETMAKLSPLSQRQLAFNMAEDANKARLATEGSLAVQGMVGKNQLAEQGVVGKNRLDVQTLANEGDKYRTDVTGLTSLADLQSREKINNANIEAGRFDKKQQPMKSLGQVTRPNGQLDTLIQIPGLDRPVLYSQVQAAQQQEAMSDSLMQKYSNPKEGFVDPDSKWVFSKLAGGFVPQK